MKDGKSEHSSYVIISSVLIHDTVAVQVFIAKLINFLSSKMELRKIMFVSDGAASQYKNRKNFASLCQYKTKYNLDVEWHFFATSHGKGPCDAIGGTVKRMATRASLAKSHEHPITDARTLYEWARQRRDSYMTAISFDYVSEYDYELGVKEWENIHHNSKMIPGTQQLHAFVPISENKISAKLFSLDDFEQVFKVVKNSIN